jgi:hypothetical protein
MLNSTDERCSEGIRISNPCGGGPATVRRIVLSEAVDAQPPFFLVELRGILSAGNAPSVGLFGYPTLVADVGVAAGEVHGRDDAPGFRRCVIGHGQPRAGGSMLLDVLGRRFNAHVRKAGALEVESAKLFAVHLEWALIPVALDSLPQLSRGFSPPVRVVKHLALRRLRRVFGLGNLTRHIGSINYARIRFQGVARAHTVNYAIIS